MNGAAQVILLIFKSPIPEVSDRVKSVMSRLAALTCFGALLLAQGRLHAQVTATAPGAEATQYTPRWDLYGGAQYAHFNPGTGHGNQVAANNLLGWNATATVWLHPSWGIDASVRGVYGNLRVAPNRFGIPLRPPMSEHLVLFGPDFRVVRTVRYAVGFHALIGAAYGDFSSGFPPNTYPQMVDMYNTKLAFGMGVGPSIDYNVTPRWSVRVIPDWLSTHYGFSFQNEFAGSIGLVYRIGSLSK